MKLLNLLKEQMAVLKGYAKDILFVRKHFTAVDKSYNDMVKKLAKEGKRKEALELQQLYKKHFIEFKIKFEDFVRKNK